MWGKDRDTAIARMLRTLRETEVEGVYTTIPADVAILAHPDFSALEHSTKWVEEVLDLSGLVASKGDTAPAGGDGEAAPKTEREVDVEVNGKRFAVKVWLPEELAAPAPAAAAPGRSAARPRRSAAAGGAGAAAGSGQVAVPMQGTIVKVLVAQGDTVEAGAAVCVLEAMKMENQILAERGGTVAKVNVEAGQTVSAGDVVVVIE